MLFEFFALLWCTPPLSQQTVIICFPTTLVYIMHNRSNISCILYYDTEWCTPNHETELKLKLELHWTEVLSSLWEFHCVRGLHWQFSTEYRNYQYNSSSIFQYGNLSWEKQQCAKKSVSVNANESTNNRDECGWRWEVSFQLCIPLHRKRNKLKQRR